MEAEEKKPKIRMLDTGSNCDNKVLRTGREELEICGWRPMKYVEGTEYVKRLDCGHKVMVLEAHGVSLLR